MSIFDFFKKKPSGYPRYEDSSRRAVYEDIARNLNASPQRVYEIAHGRTIRTFDDEVIYEQLVQKGILKS